MLTRAAAIFFVITPLRCSVVSLQMATHELEWRQSHADAQPPQQRGRGPLHPTCHHQVRIRDLLSLRLCQRCDYAYALDFKSTLCPVKVLQLSPWMWVSGLKWDICDVHTAAQLLPGVHLSGSFQEVQWNWSLVPSEAIWPLRPLLPKEPARELMLL